MGNHHTVEMIRIVEMVACIESVLGTRLFGRNNFVLKGWTGSNVVFLSLLYFVNPVNRDW